MILFPDYKFDNLLQKIEKYLHRQRAVNNDIGNLLTKKDYHMEVIDELLMEVKSFIQDQRQFHSNLRDEFAIVQGATVSWEIIESLTKRVEKLEKDYLFP